MSNYTAPAAPTVTPAAPAANQPPSQAQGGGPYLPHSAVLGGLPTVPLDVPICAVFLVLFIAGATFNMTIFQINRRHNYKFLFSGLLFGFCMARIVAMSTRIVWATRPTNIQVAIASQIFTAAGVILLFITNLVFAQRIIRAYHPFFGWSKPVSLFFSGLYFSIIAILIMVIAATIHMFFTLNPSARQTDRTIQLFCGTYLAAIAFLPIPLVLLTLIIPRRTRIDKFGQGHFSTKFALLLFTAALLATGAIFRAVTNFYVEPIQHPAWFQSKVCYYCFNFAIEVVVVYIYALSRFDKRFHIPNGSSAPGHYSCSEDGRSPASVRTSAASSARHLALGRRSGEDQGMLSLSDLENLKYPAAVGGGVAHSYRSKRASGWSGQTVRSSGLGKSGGGRRSVGGVRSAPRSVRSVYVGVGGEGARSEADVVNMEADMEWMARAMRELYGDDEGESSSTYHGRTSYSSHQGRKSHSIHHGRTSHGHRRSGE